MALISVVIPNYNSNSTISRTISSLNKQSFSDFDVVIVDDKSRDGSVSLIKDMIKGSMISRIKDKPNFKLIELPVNKGAANARNVGATESNGRIILFIDSDIILKEDTVKKVIEFFKENKDADAVVGIPDKVSCFSNIASEHFNLRVHYNYKHFPRYIDILNTSICAVKRKVFEKVRGFNAKMRSEEDPELGFRIREAGYNILFDKELAVYHYKHISFLGLLKNDYKRSISRIKLMLRKRMINGAVAERKGFISTPISQIYSAMITPFVWLSLVIGIFVPLFFVATWLLLLLFFIFYSEYLGFVSKEKGFLTALGFYFLLIIDMTVVDIGLFSGAFKYIAGERY